MASTAAAIDQAANPKSVDESLWWDSFVDLIDELENASLSLDISPSLIKKVESNHGWFLDTVSRFKPQNQKSKVALDSKIVDVGSHRLNVKPELKDLALQISSFLDLDEVQSYILVKRCVERSNADANIKDQELLHLIMLQYYIERQCLLKCTRQIFMHTLYIGNGSKTDGISVEASRLISSGLDKKLLIILQDLLSSKHPEHMEVHLVTLWVEDILIEDNLVMEILFLAYYESFCTCSGEQWRSLCSLYRGILSGSLNVGKLAISAQARSSFYHSKVQLLLILIETLGLENILQMVHDEVPFRQGYSIYSLIEIQEMDAMISSFDAIETEEAGPLILAWAVFLCLISSLPEKEDNSELMEIDHIGYIHQAFKSAPLGYTLDILENDILKVSDGSVAGYRSVLRTFISAFIASYDMALQFEDGTLHLILDILCRIYRGEESLCAQFWDRDSFIDGPIRCLLCTLEGEFPHQTVELLRFLSALCEGTWPAECVYNFLDRSVGISSLVEVSGDTSISQTIETRQSLHVPGVEDLLIPSQTRGQILKIIDGNRALVRWEYMQSGVLVLLLRLARQLYLNCYEETLDTLDLLCRLVSSNPAVCYALMDVEYSFPVQKVHMNGHMDCIMRVDVVEIICNSVRNLPPNVSSAVVMSMSISILAKMMKCSPSHVTSLVLKRNIFDVALNANKVDLGSNISGTWFLSGGLATMLLIDCEHTSDYCPLTVSVLDFTMQLMETGADNDIVLALVVFSLQYVFVNHEHWRYKSKDVRWKVTLKVLEVMKKCITLIPVSGKLGGTIRDILLCDTSIHNKLCRLICINKRALENLFVGRLYEVEEIEGIQLAVSYSLEIVFTVLDVFSKDAMTSVPVFHQAMLSSTAKPISVFSAVMSLISYSHNPAIQIGAAKVISSLCIVAENAKPYLLGNVCLVSDDTQIADLRYSIYEILSEETPRNKDLSIATLRLLISAARHQPPFLISIMSTEDNNAVLLSNSGGIKEHSKKVLSRPLESKNVGLVETMMCYVKRFEDLIERHPHFLLNLLNFLEVLWDGATQYVQILDFFKASEVFWNKLSSILAISTVKSPFVAINGDGNLCLAFKFQCHSSALNIMAYDMFLDKKLEPSETIKNTGGSEQQKAAYPADLKSIVSAWFEGSVIVNLVKTYAACGYDNEIFRRAKIAATLLLVHLMGKLTVGDGGSLSVSLIEKIQSMSTKLSEQPAFSRLLAQYSSHGYSEEKDLKNLLLSDLYYHIQGELEGRKINPGPFDELGQYLFELKFLLPDEHKHISKYPEQSHDVYVYDLVGLRADLSTEFWDHSDWKTSKEIAERTLKYMHDANLMAYLAGSKLLALKSLTTILYVYMENETSVGGMNPEPLIRSCIDHVCKCLQTTIKSLVPAVNPSDVSIDFLGAEAELLLCLVRLSNKRLLKNANQEMSASICSCIIKTSCAGLRLLSSIRPSVVGRSKTIKLFLILLLTSIETAHSGSLVKEQGNEESVLSSLGLLPILCDCVEAPEYCTLSLAIIDYLLKSYLTYDTWFPIIQNHLHLRVLIQKLLEKESVVSIPIILKFLLSLARIRGGAEMLVSANFFSAFKIVISHLIDEKRVISFQDNKDEQPSQIWGLGLAIVAAMVHSLGDSTSSVDLVDIMIPYFFSEKTYLMFYHLNALDIPSVDHDKKRPRSQKQVTSLTALKETEQTLMLICVLAKSKNLWIKVMKETVSQLRERCIHILAFISRGVHRIGESPSRTISLLCPPILKNDIELNRSPSFVNSKQGWFSTMAKTSFTDTVAIQMYRIALLLLNFLCLQVKETTKRAEEVGYIDLAHFPELPMPEILHYLQDHAIVIVTELCQADKLKEKQPVILEVCLLLLQIMEKSLYLEHCVSHTCEIRPVLGRVEDFSKEIKMFMHAVKDHVFLKASVKSLKQIISFVYPGLLQSEGIL